MCTLVMLRRPDHGWPLLLAANRDERRSRPSLPPGRHWADRDEVLAGLDITGGGSWLGLNDHGLAAAVMNRHGTLGPERGKRSRGDLVLEALDHAEAGEAAGALADLHPGSYRPFNLVVADAFAAYWLRHGGDGEIRIYPISPGLHMLSSGELDDAGHPRIRAHLDNFLKVPIPDPARGRWEGWKALLAGRGYPADDGPNAALNLDFGEDFATVSSSLIALPTATDPVAKPVWLHANGPPDREPYRPVSLGI